MFDLPTAIMLGAALSPLGAAFLGVCYAIDRYNARRRTLAYRLRQRRRKRR